jgi:hypothetical protein
MLRGSMPNTTELTVAENGKLVANGITQVSNVKPWRICSTCSWTPFVYPTAGEAASMYFVNLYS